LDKLRTKNFEEAFLNLKSLQFCSVSKIKQIENEKKKEILNAQNKWKQDIQEVEKKFSEENQQMKGVIDELELK